VALGTQQAAQETNSLTQAAAEAAKAATAIIEETNCFTKATQSSPAP